ncbi:MAG: pyridoxine 5'-phosphate synthase [Acidobacteriota bacterium]|nr:pyridoxine 5'-phosphate synthase [Acidobacteriota bacterium]
MPAKLNVNIDHVATVRQARRAPEPSVIAAAVTCEQAGAHGITVHLRQDRRHIQDQDIRLLKQIVTTYLNVEMAATDEMIGIAAETMPDAVTLVPESPSEITTEGGLDVVSNFETVRSSVEKLRETGIFTSIFIDPDKQQIEASSRAGAQQIELCTAEYAELTLGGRASHSAGLQKAEKELKRLAEAAVHAKSLGLAVAAGHGLTYRNIGGVAAIADITEFNIGHNIISRSIFTGLYQAVREMIEAIERT